MNRFNTDSAQSQVFDKNGAFFAFSNKQFDEAKKEDIKYMSLGGGLIVPEINAETLVKELDSICNKKIKFELANNSIKDLIWYELANHECQISCDYGSVVSLLAPYGITEDMIKAEYDDYYQNCIDNDYF